MRQTAERRRGLMMWSVMMLDTTRLAFGRRTFSCVIPVLTVIAILSASVGCGSEEPAAAPAKVEQIPTCSDKFGAAPAWQAGDQLSKIDCSNRSSGLWACNQRGAVVDCFTCDAIKTTFDPSAVGAGSLKALGVDEAELLVLQKNYDTGCIALVGWDQFAQDAISKELLCKSAMGGLKVCRNIDGLRQWWQIKGERFLRYRVQTTLANSRGFAYFLELPTTRRDVLDLAQWPFLSCDDLVATTATGWDLWTERAKDVLTVKIDLVEPKKAAAEPDNQAFSRLSKVFTTCDASYGNWE